MPKTKDQFEQIKEERKKEILDAALYLFAVEGYDTVTSDSITKRVGCSHGLLYHYFKTKEELLIYVVKNVAVTNYQELVQDVDLNQNPKVFFRNVLSAILKGLENSDIKYACSLNLLFNIHLQKKLYAKIQEARERGKKLFFDLFREKLEEGKQMGLFNDFNTIEMAAAIGAVLKGLSYTKIHLLDEFICPSVDILMRMITKD